MKQILKFSMLIFVLMLPLAMFGQEEVPTTPDELFGGLEALYGALVIIVGYLSAFIPGLKKIPKGVYRVLAFAIISGAAFVYFGWSNAIGIIFTYAISTSIYEVILKLFAKSPPPEQ